MEVTGFVTPLSGDNPESDRLVIQRDASGSPKHSYELFATLGAGSLTRHLVLAAFHRQGGRLRGVEPCVLGSRAAPGTPSGLAYNCVPVAHCGFEGTVQGGRVPASLRAFQCRETLSHVQRWCVLVSDRFPWRQSLGWDSGAG